MFWGLPIIVATSLPTGLERHFFTLIIGVKYVWVERYCTQQDDSADMFHQISQMDNIYQSSTAITIEASCRTALEGYQAFQKRDDHSRSLDCLMAP